MVEHNDKTDRGAKMNFFVHAHAAKYVVKILRVCKTVVPRYKLSSGFFVTIVRVGKLLLSFYCLQGRTFYALADTQEIGVESFESLISLNSWILITQYSLRLYLSAVVLSVLVISRDAKYL